MRNNIILVLIATALVLTIVWLSTELDSVQETVSNLESESENKLAEIAKLEDVIKSQSEKLNQYKEELEVSKKELESKEKAILELNGKIDELKDELSYYDNLRQLDVVATAYTSKCDGCTGITATGTNVKNTIHKDGKRVVAVDPNVIALGSILHVETNNDSFVAVADDVGGAIKGRKIDLLVSNKKVAYDFGRQNVTVTVLKEG